MRFSGKRVFVTGASRGLGHAIAAMFRSEGANVTGTRTTSADEGGDVCDEWVVADFSDIAQIRACAEFVRQAEPDVLVNNAGINRIAPFAEIAPDDFQLVQQVNVFAPFLLCRSAVPAMARKRWGRIVNVSSIWGKISKAHRASYSASKFALDGMTVALAAEYSAHGVLANCVAPGFIDTDLTRRVLGDSGIQTLLPAIPAQRLGQTDEIAHAVLWLSSAENTYLTGQNIAVDGGFSRV